MCFIPSSGKHPTERGREATTPADSIRYDCQEIRNCAKRLMYRVSGSGRPQGSLARGTSPSKLQGSYFPSVLGDTSVFSSLLVIRLHIRTSRFVAGESFFAEKFPSLAPRLPRDVLVPLQESCWESHHLFQIGRPLVANCE